MPDRVVQRLAADRPRRRSSGSSSTNDYDPRRLLTHPRADPGGVRPPAGRRAPAHQPLDRRLVQRDLRHRHLLPAPGLRARARRRRSACAAARRARCWAAAVSATRSSTRSARTSAGSRPTARCASWRPTAAARAATSRCVTVDGQPAAGHDRRQTARIAGRVAAREQRQGGKARHGTTMNILPATQGHADASCSRAPASTTPDGTSPRPRRPAPGRPGRRRHQP